IVYIGRGGKNTYHIHCHKNTIIRQCVRVVCVTNFLHTRSRHPKAVRQPKQHSMLKQRPQQVHGMTKKGIEKKHVDQRSILERHCTPLHLTSRSHTTKNNKKPLMKWVRWMDIIILTWSDFQNVCRRFLTNIALQPSVQLPNPNDV